MENRRGTTRPPLRVVLLVPAGLALLAGLDGALVLLGVPAPIRADRLGDVHGQLMVLGVVGTLVALERAVAVRRTLAFASPVLLAAGSLALLPAWPTVVGRALHLAGTLALVGIYLLVWRRQPVSAVAVQGAGALAAAGSALLLLAGVPVPVVTPWFVAFLVLTVVGERLELMRFAPPPVAVRAALVVATLLLVMGAAVALLHPVAGGALLGVALVAQAALLARHDVARRTVRSTGLPRFMALAMLAGFAWLAVAGSLWLLAGAVTDGPAYDAVLHAVFLGFVMSMVIAHAPVILPAVLRRPLPYRPVMLVPLALLHVSLAFRLLAGDAWGSVTAVRVGGVANVVAVLMFLGTAAWSVAVGPPARDAGRRRAEDEPDDGPDDVPATAVLDDARASPAPPTDAPAATSAPMSLSVVAR
ncbi:hypothetical protein [Cellulomonas sp.]|uniref:hypothetical protein n=1 Tax=Cellulomonas sp. TaxID=40001 RepID=UPI001B0CD57D|nr:hypothetical protein [Cellulomonas sp.]MBO9556293.1 hypothetical protein [Cellulomonas sp.]